MAAKAAIHAFFRTNKEVAFLKKSSAKNFCPAGNGLGNGEARKAWMAAFAAMTGNLSGTEPDSQKSFAELRAPMTERERGLNRAAQLRFRKATAYFPYVLV